MEFVEPITNLKKLDQMSNNLYKESERNYLLFAIGINLGLRISDYLSKSVGFFREATLKGYIEIKPEKTVRYDKSVRVYVGDELKNIIESYIAGKYDSELMFPSRKTNDGKEQAITRQQAYRIINGAARDVGIVGNIGCHSMRKTFGYWHYQKNHDVRLLMQIFNHASEAVTLRYIGVTNENIKDSMQGMNLGIVRH